MPDEKPAPAKVKIPDEPAATPRAATPNERALAAFIQIPREDSEQLLANLRDLGFDTIAKVLRAYDDRRITRAERDLLIREVVDDLGQSAVLALDMVTVLPEPLETLADLGIAQGIEVAKPLLAELITDTADFVDDVFERSAEQFEKRIDRVEAKLADAKGRQANRLRRRLDRLMRRFYEEHPHDAHAFGIRRQVDGDYVRSSRG